MIAAGSNHFIRCKCKITHCLDSQTLTEYISKIVLDDNEKHTKRLEVLIGDGTFASASSFDTQTLQFVTMNELKKPMSDGLQIFPFYLVVPYSVCFLLELEATSHNVMFLGRWTDASSIRSGLVFFRRGDKQFTYHFNK